MQNSEIFSLKSWPTFSIIVPTYNRPRALQRCLQALSELDYPSDRFEIIVVDDGGKYPLQGIVNKFKDKSRVCLLESEHQGPAAARNVGAAFSRDYYSPDYLVFTDDDCAPCRDWLHVFAENFEVHNFDFDYQNSTKGKSVAQREYLLGGKTINALTRNAFSTASQLLVDYLYEYYDASHRYHFFTSNNFALSSRAFWKLKGFDESFPPAGEDRDFCRRAIEAGIVLQFLPEARIKHYHQLSRSKFRKQHFVYGQGAFQFHFLRANQNVESGRGRLPRLEPPRFYLQLLNYPQRRRLDLKYSRARSARLSTLLFLSQLYNAAGYFYCRFWYRKR